MDATERLLEPCFRVKPTQSDEIKAWEGRHQDLYENTFYLFFCLNFRFPKDNCVMNKATNVIEGIAVVAMVAVPFSTKIFVFAQEKGSEANI